MPVRNLIVNCADVTASVEFYTTFLEARTVGQPTVDRATLDLVSATIELRASATTPSHWEPDDLQRGFRHLGFKVVDLDERSEALKQAGVSFHLEPLDAEGAVRICFFYDPDGTLLELVQGDLQYHAVHDADGVTAERALGAPERPRFDHVALTVADRDATRAFYAPLGFRLIGTIEQPSDPRGFSIGYLKGGDTVLEVFTYADPTRARTPEPDASGFGWAELSGDRLPGAAALLDNGLSTDPDGFVFTLDPVRTSV